MSTTPPPPPRITRRRIIAATTDSHTLRVDPPLHRQLHKRCLHADRQRPIRRFYTGRDVVKNGRFSLFSCFRMGRKETRVRGERSTRVRSTKNSTEFRYVGQRSLTFRFQQAISVAYACSRTYIPSVEWVAYTFRSDICCNTRTVTRRHHTPTYPHILAYNAFNFQRHFRALLTTGHSIGDQFPNVVRDPGDEYQANHPLVDR